MPMTPKQKRFVRAYAQSLNATQAAMDAGYCSTSAKTASQAAWRVMRLPEVRAAIEALRARASMDDTLNAQRVLEELRRLAFADVRGLYDDHGQLKPIVEWTQEQGSAVQEVQVALGPAGSKVLKVRYWDKTKALEMLAKHLSLLVEKTEVSGGITISWLPPEGAPSPVATPAVEGEVVASSRALPPVGDP